MDKARDLQKMIKELEREIRALKTAQDVGASVKCYYYSFTPSSLGSVTIVYADGVNPIVSQAYFNGDIVLSKVDNNEQKLFFTSQTIGEIVIVSTRPVVSVA